MELLYLHEHLSCYNYEKGERPMIEKVLLRKGQSWDVFPVDNKMIFVLEGSLQLSFGDVLEEVLPEGKIAMLPAGSEMKGVANTDSKMLILRLHNTTQLCDCFSLDVLLREETDDFQPGLYYLDINDRALVFISFLEACMDDGLRCTYFFELKIKEFCFLLRAYYPKSELLAFFYPLLSRDISFSDFIIKNYYKTKSVKELAELTHYSLSGFQKRFKKVFGISAYNWLKEARSKSVLHQINSTEKSFKEISDEYGFSSPSHFNDFCKINFGATPGKIRRKKLFSSR